MPQYKWFPEEQSNDEHESGAVLPHSAQTFPLQ